MIAAAKQLKVIGRHGVGVDNIDVKAATKKGIVVVYTPNANATSVAEHTLTAIGALAKRAVAYDRATREGRWEIRNSYKAVDLDGKTLGLVGIGRIGSMVARRVAAAYNMKVIAFDPYVTPETRGFVNEAKLRLMKPTAFLINFSRGEVVNEKPLFEGLKENIIAAAAIDVYDPEPPLKENPLFALENILLSPHSAALTEECVIRMATGAAEGVVDVLSGRRPQFVVNPEVFEP